MRRLLAFRDAEASGTVLGGGYRASKFGGGSRENGREKNGSRLQLRICTDIACSRHSMAFRKGIRLSSFCWGEFLGLKWDVLLRAHENV